MLSVKDYLQEVSMAPRGRVRPCGCVDLNDGTSAESSAVVCPYHVGRFDGITEVMDNPAKYGLKKEAHQ